MTRITASLLAGVLALGGCAAPGSGSPAPPDELTRELAQTPDPLPPSERADDGRTKGRKGQKDGREKENTPKTGDQGSAETPAGTGRGGGGANDGSGRGGSRDTKPEPSEAEERLLGSAADARGDHGVLGPQYADLDEVSIATRGDSAIATVDFVGTLPARLDEGEVMGVGIDIFRSDAAESDYQLFADGGSDGWFAYLHTPEGFVKYPGSFSIGGSRMVFEVPWSALGGGPKGSFSSFLDWSGPGAVAVSPSSQDFAPDSGTVRLA
jgi:hypothetical protein